MNSNTIWVVCLVVLGIVAVFGFDAMTTGVRGLWERFEGFVNICSRHGGGQITINRGNTQVAQVTFATNAYVPQNPPGAGATPAAGGAPAAAPPVVPPAPAANPVPAPVARRLAGRNYAIGTPASVTPGQSYVLWYRPPAGGADQTLGTLTGPRQEVDLQGILGGGLPPAGAGNGAAWLEDPTAGAAGAQVPLSF